MAVPGRRWFPLVAAMLGCSLQSAGLDENLNVAGDAIGDTTVVTLDEGVVDTAVETEVDAFIATDTATVADTKAADTAVDTFGADAIVAVADTRDASADTGCALGPPTAAPCYFITLREALAAGQTLDGRADDFCDVPYVDFTNSAGTIRDPSTTPPEGTTTMRIRVAWSSFGLHAHLSVKDPKILVAMPATEKNLFLGDSAEIYVAGYDGLTGSFDGTTKDIGAQQIILAPPTPDSTVGTRAQYFYPGIGAKGPPASDHWTARLTTDGYEIELRLPWSELKPAATPTPIAGKKIALTWALNNKYDPTKQQAFSVYQSRPIGSPPIAGCNQPYCDDRMWCTPTLL